VGQYPGFQQLYNKQNLTNSLDIDDKSIKQASHWTMATTSKAQAITNVDTAATFFRVGQLVNVAPRTWPGINQPGGIGRITGFALDSVSVRYVLDGPHEKEY
jgi:hypothetical protein